MIVLTDDQTRSIYTEVLEGSNGKAMVSVALMEKQDRDHVKARVQLWSCGIVVATVSYYKSSLPALAIHATPDQLTPTTLRHLRKFLGRYIPKSDLVWRVRNLSYMLVPWGKGGFKIKEVDNANANYDFVNRAMDADIEARLEQEI